MILTFQSNNQLNCNVTSMFLIWFHGCAQGMGSGLIRNQCLSISLGGKDGYLIYVCLIAVCLLEVEERMET